MRPNFHYALEEKFLTVKQGVFRKQERHVPYGVIQTLCLKQDILDRCFDLASLAVEDASQGGQAQQGAQMKFFGLSLTSSRRSTGESLGFSGNKISIPGLSVQNAEALKAAILQKMKDNPMEDSQSGL